MNRRTIVATVVALALFSTSVVNLAHAIGVIPSLGLSARAEVVASGIGENEFDNINTPAVANKIFSNGGVSGEAHAIADYGLLKTSTTLTKGTAVEPFNFGTAEAIFSDELTITGGTGPGTVSMQFHNTGELTLPSAISDATARTTLNVFFTDGTFQGDNKDYEVTSGTSATIDDVFTTSAFNFTFGVPFSFDVRLNAEVALEESDSGTVINDFFNTSSLQLLTVDGATGPVSITSFSGTNYSTVPEPTSILLLIVAAASMSRRCGRIVS